MSDFCGEKKSLIEIAMFGGFSIKIDDKILTDDTGRTKQLWILLEYLVANRHIDISQEKLIEILWEDEDCDNPLNAMKNLVYRLRSMLNDLTTDKYEFIVFKRNVYSWNNDLPCIIDSEEFEKSYKAAKISSLPAEERLKHYMEAINIYKGEFLPKSSMKDWVVACSEYYRNIFIECVKAACVIFQSLGEYENAALICEKAVAVDPFDETMHELIINNYLVSGNRQKAVAHYEYVSNMFYEKLGLKLSDNFRNLMREVIRSVSGIENDLDVINEDLREREKIDSAYFCDYEIFKSIYRIEVRLTERFGQSVFVALLTLETSGKEKQAAVSDAMQFLKTVILSSLRKSDIVSRFSNTQFILMLPSLTFENGQMVLNRISKKFYEKGRISGFKLHTKLNPLSPLQ